MTISTTRLSNSLWHLWQSEHLLVNFLLLFLGQELHREAGPGHSEGGEGIAQLINTAYGGLNQVPP